MYIFFMLQDKKDDNIIICNKELEGLFKTKTFKAGDLPEMVENLLE